MYANGEMMSTQRISLAIFSRLVYWKWDDVFTEVIG